MPIFMLFSPIITPPPNHSQITSPRFSARMRILNVGSLTGSSISLCLWCTSLCSSMTPVKSRWDVPVKLIGKCCYENNLMPPTHHIIHFSVSIWHDHHQIFTLLSQLTSTGPTRWGSLTQIRENILINVNNPVSSFNPDKYGDGNV